MLSIAAEERLNFQNIFSLHFIASRRTFRKKTHRRRFEFSSCKRLQPIAAACENRTGLTDQQHKDPTFCWQSKIFTHEHSRRVKNPHNTAGRSRLLDPRTCLECVALFFGLRCYLFEGNKNERQCFGWRRTKKQYALNTNHWMRCAMADYKTTQRGKLSGILNSKRKYKK